MLHGEGGTWKGGKGKERKQQESLRIHPLCFFKNKSIFRSKCVVFMFKINLGFFAEGAEVSAQFAGAALEEAEEKICLLPPHYCSAHSALQWRKTSHRQTDRQTDRQRDTAFYIQKKDLSRSNEERSLPESCRPVFCTLCFCTSVKQARRGNKKKNRENCNSLNQIGGKKVRLSVKGERAKRESFL